MTWTKRMTVAVCMVAVCTGMMSAQQYTIKKSKITVMVGEDQNCLQGISVSDRFPGGRRLCADYPDGVSNRLKKLVGFAVELEAFWTFEGDLNRGAPVALGRIFRIDGEKVDDTCATKAHSLGGTPMATNGKDAASCLPIRAERRKLRWPEGSATRQ
jgi:hypothetical protein